MKKLNLPNDEIRDLYLSKMMSTMQIAHIFGCCPSTILERLKDINVKIRGGGRHYTKKFFPRSTRIPNSQEKLAYLAGIVDSEGTIGFILNKKRLQERVAPRLKVGNTNYNLIAWITSEIGGRVYKHEDGRHKPCYEWFVSGVQNIQPLLEAILPYLVIKQDKAKEVLEFCQSEIEKRGGVYLAPLSNYSFEREEQIERDKQNFLVGGSRQDVTRGSRRRMKPIQIQNSLKLAYLAGVIDGDGSISFIINKKRLREKVAPRIRVHNTDTKLIMWLEKEIGGYVGGVTTDGRHNPCYEWLITGEQNIKPLLQAIFPFLIVKRENAEEILKFYEKSD